jgi:lia operon protein LiaF
MLYKRGFWTLFTGSLFVILGILVLLDNLDMISFKMVWKIYWPLILILIGILIVLKRYTLPQNVFKAEFTTETVFSDESQPEDSRKSETEYNQSNVFGNIKYSTSSKEYPGGNINNIFGDILVDLSEIDFPEGSRDLAVSGVFGSLRIKLPPNIAVKFSGSTIAGTVKFLEEKKDGLLINLNSQTADYDSASKKLNVRASLIFGDMKIK